MADCCNCCGFTSLVGVVFFGLTSVMVKRENAVFLSHKAGLNLHTVTPEQIDEKFMAMITTACVFAGAMLFCFLTSFCLSKREAQKTAEAATIKAQHARVAFETDNTTAEGMDEGKQ